MKHEGRSWCTSQIQQQNTAVQDEGSSRSLVSMIVKHIEHRFCIASFLNDGKETMQHS